MQRFDIFCDIMNITNTPFHSCIRYRPGGTVWCVGSVSSTYTYVVVYNNDSTVDDTTTFRFACFAISSDGKNASMVPRNCTANQTPYDFPRSASGSLTGAKLYMTAYASCFSKERTDACEFASKFQNSTWRDSTKGDLTFSKTTMAGWSFMTEGRTVSNWRCFGERVIESQTYLILKLTDSISGKVPVFAYLCLRITHQSDYSVYYYQTHGQEFSAGQERLLLTTNSSVPDTSQMCDTSSIEPMEQFHVMLKSGYESTAKQNCPNAIRGNFDYVYYGAGGSVACNSVYGNLEVCTDNKTMVFNYTRCNQVMAYSTCGLQNKVSSTKSIINGLPLPHNTDKISPCLAFDLKIREHKYYNP
ncbi:hypothetical protein CHS0354_025220 [Potamilus streckersoni]|uniref:Uncharacterized protein n=1 Tax=Potamilus streckersoni TaxID=2493646 RepID=A0AAE0RMV0_9BIVA|nr:hypothetical protein CHS0354_025220 [Potamilus streckersoni]